MGGAYLTLLNTIANMGVILPKSPLYAAMDVLTVSTCRDAGGAVIQGLTCPKKLRELQGSNQCTDAGDGSHPMQWLLPLAPTAELFTLEIVATSTAL